MNQQAAILRAPDANLPIGLGSVDNRACGTICEADTMTTKQCFKCHEVKPLDDFYKHPIMTDGHLGKCKECAKRDGQENYAKRRAQYSAYDQRRYREPRRRRMVLGYARARAKRTPEKTAARRRLTQALRSGKIVRWPCEVCGVVRGVQAHHDDYSKPFDVRWLCFQHHRALHGQTVTCVGYAKAPSRE